MHTISIDIEALKQECHYSDEGGFDDEGNDLGSVDALIDYKDALEDAVSNLPQPIVTDTNKDGSPASTFEPWTDGHAIGFKVTRHHDHKVGYVYLNPSQDTMSDGKFNPDVFVYTGTTGKPALDSPHHFYNIDFDN